MSEISKEPVVRPVIPFVEIIIILDGQVVNTVTGEFPEFARCIAALEQRGDQVTKVTPINALGQDVYRVKRTVLVHLLGSLYNVDWQQMIERPNGWPEGADYYVVVSY